MDLTKGLVAQKMMLAMLSALLIFTSGCSNKIKTMIGEPLIYNETHLRGVKRTVNVGDFMTSSAPFAEQETLILKNSLVATTEHRGKPLALTAAPGGYTLVRQHRQGKFFEAAEKLVTVNGQDRAGGIFLPNSSANSSALYWSSTSSRQAEPERNLAMYMADINIKPDVIKTSSILLSNYTDGFVSTLTFAGMAGGQIKFSYREFNNGLARDAYTQEVALDYQPGHTYVYKSARFIVHEANTTEITLTLLQPL